MAAGRTHITIFTVALGSFFVLCGCTHTSATADLSILAGRAGNRAVITEPPLFAHALHRALRSLHAVSLAKARHRLSGMLFERTGLLTDTSTMALLAQALGGETLSSFAAFKQTFTLP